MKKIAIGRLLGLVLMVCAIGMSIWFGKDAAKLKSQFYQWIDDIPMIADVDLTAPGASNVSFTQTCQCSHGEFVYLDPVQLELTPDNYLDKLAGIKGRIEIADSNGEIVETTGFDDSTLTYWDNEYTLTRIPIFGIGEYTAHIHIDSPATNLPPQPHRLTAKYQLCGLELMPAQILQAVAIFWALTAGIAGLFTVPWLLRLGVWSIESPNDP